jgi:hypothetical protein
LQSFGRGGGTIGYTVEANTGHARQGTIFLEGESFTVRQGAICAFTLSADHKSFAANGGSSSFTVNCNAGCTWDATENLSWVTITAGFVGNGTGTVNYTVSANSGTTPRSGTITVADKTFTVFQGIPFSDVPETHTYYNEIGRLSARRVTLGCNATNYCPDEVVTRQQMAAFIIRALGDFDPPAPSSQRFVDVPPGNPFYAFIEQMAVRRITEGCDTNPLRYCPLNPVLRDQMAAFIIRALGEFDPPQPPFQRFLDVPPSQPFYRFIDRMAVLNITNGCDANLYCPSLAVSRGQMAAFLVRAFNL